MPKQASDNPTFKNVNEKFDLKRLYFDLNDSIPIEVIFNEHTDLKECWFDMHYAVEIGIVVSGKMTRHYLDHEIVIEPGEVWICGMWEPHGFFLDKTPCEVVVFVIDPDFIVKKNPFDFNIFSLFQLDPKKRPQVFGNKKREILQIANKAKEKLRKKEDPNWTKVLFFELLLTIIDNVEVPLNFKKDYEFHKGIQPALRMVFERRELISSKEAADSCNMSVSSFRSKFKELMKLPFSDFALKYRIKGALTQMKNSHSTQETIANNWGFTDASHLQKNIKSLAKKTGKPYS